MTGCDKRARAGYVNHNTLEHIVYLAALLFKVKPAVVHCCSNRCAIGGIQYTNVFDRGDDNIDLAGMIIMGVPRERYR